MTSTSDPFRYDDGAYVLGALDNADRRAFEAHLKTCPDCQERVADARAAADLLSGVTAIQVGDPPPMPDTVLPGLLSAAKRERARRRWLIASLGAAAAASLAALVVLLWPTGSTEAGPVPRALTPVRPSPLTATVKLVARGWGTEIDLDCRYPNNAEHHEPYSLMVVDDSGEMYPAGSWTLAVGTKTTFTGGTRVPTADIAKVEITREDGTPILALTT
ncbi:MAG TPA: zf-HC2 domain-containing protein [Mycobacterium sp.]|jgi:anti-sigma factor RsiW|nr:zf-HC2 domain-containing protein [Mycobacterium sp.]